MVLDTDLERQIAMIVARLSAGRGWRLDPAATAHATRKQAMVPVGATVIAPVGTAPGLVIPPRTARPDRRWSCCPARRVSCRRCGPPR